METTYELWIGGKVDGRYRKASAAEAAFWRAARSGLPCQLVAPTGGVIRKANGADGACTEAEDEDFTAAMDAE